jgi:hypothetical protein
MWWAIAWLLVWLLNGKGSLWRSKFFFIYHTNFF